MRGAHAGLPARALRARSSPSATLRTRRRRRPPAPPGRRRRLPDRRTAAAARVLKPTCSAISAVVGSSRRAPSEKMTSGRLRRSSCRAMRRAPRLPPPVVGLHVEPLIGNLVAREEIFDVVRARATSGCPSTRMPSNGGRKAGLPVVEQIVEHGIELLLGRIPGLQQVVVDARLVDRADGRVRVGVGGQEHALGIGVRARWPAPETRRPIIPGIRWSTRKSATGSFRTCNSRTCFERRLARSRRAARGTRSRTCAAGRARWRAAPPRRRPPSTIQV